MMGKLLALITLSLALLIGVNAHARADGNPGFIHYTQIESSRLIGGDDGFITFGRQTVSSEAVCITVDELLTYQRESPPPFPSAWVMGELEGARAQKFVLATGGAQVAHLTGFVYFFQAPTERPGQVLALLADPEGCAILMSGERALTAGKSAGVVLQTWQLRKLLMGLFGTPLSV